MRNSQVLITGCKKLFELQRNSEKRQNSPWKGVLQRAQLHAVCRHAVNPTGPDISEEQNRTKCKSYRAQRAEQKKRRGKLITERLILKRREEGWPKFHS